MKTKARTDKRRTLPLDIRLLALAASWLGRLFPGVMSGWAYRLWLRTRRFPPKPDETRQVGRARRLSLGFGKRALAAYEWGGDGPPVLLIHGWNGRGPQLSALADPLVARGFRVIALDGPGHGRSPGHRSDLRVFTDALHVAADTWGPLAGAVAHSFGGICLCTAMHEGLAVARAVIVGTPARYEDLVIGFAAHLRLPSPLVARFRSRMEAGFGADLWERYAPLNCAPDLRVPGLVVHDAKDRVVPAASARAIAEAWPHARLLVTDGLGHYRILSDANVVTEIADFVCGAPT